MKEEDEEEGEEEEEEGKKSDFDLSIFGDWTESPSAANGESHWQLCIDAVDGKIIVGKKNRRKKNQ